MSLHIIGGAKFLYAVYGRYSYTELLPSGCMECEGEVFRNNKGFVDSQPLLLHFVNATGERGGGPWENP